MKIIGVIRSTATEEISVEADDYPSGRASLEAEIPAGFELIAVRKG